MSFLTSGTSFKTSSNLSKAFCCFNWDIKLDNIPPGTWYFKILGLQDRTFGFNIPFSKYLAFTVANLEAALSNKSASSFGSYSVPRKA